MLIILCWHIRCRPIYIGFNITELHIATLLITVDWCFTGLVQDFLL